VLLSCAAPGTAGFSVNYLIEATFAESDSAPVVLPYYNASNPATAYSGPANAGTTNNTKRQGIVTLVAKVGTAATTGTQTTPAPDAGYVGLAVVTVANGAASITNSNISAYFAAPVLPTGGLLNSAQQIAVAAGTADVITANFTPAATALTNGLTLMVRANLANATTTPSFAPNGLTAKTIVKGNGLALAAGDIAGAGHWIELQYDLSLDKWVLQNPATGVTTNSRQIQPVTASVASNALTCTLNPTSLDFRSATLGAGTVNTRSVGTAISVVVPSTATLGTVSATQSRLVLLAIDNAGTVELAIVNIAGGNDLSETGLISTTAISAGATSASVVYSNTARTNVAYRVIGYVESTQATAGTWATAPSTIQGMGGQALAAMSSLGYGQTWQNVTGSRALATTYYNTTGKPIFINIQTAASSANGQLLVNGVAASTCTSGPSAWGTYSAVVPAGCSYILSGSSALSIWAELR
jgi:hypothetical protein